MLELIVDKEQSLKTFTENNYAQGSFFWTQLLKGKDIKINGTRVLKDCTVFPGDVIQYYTNKKQEEKPAFFTVYKDENFCVVDKESGVNSEAVFAALCREMECYFIHRIDRNTKGLLIFALTIAAETALLDAFKNRKTVKKYHALCLGEFEKESAFLTAYLKKDRGMSLVKVFDTQVKGSETILTEYKVLSKNADGTSKVEVLLHTGKTHQIRAHFAFIGHPLLGDMKYGNTEENKMRNLSRQCLVAKSLQILLDGPFSYLAEKEFRSQFDV